MYDSEGFPISGEFTGQRYNSEGVPIEAPAVSPVEAPAVSPVEASAEEEPAFWDNVVDAATAPYTKMGEDLGGLSDEFKQGVREIFPRGVNAAESGADFTDQVIAGVADASSLMGRGVSGLITSLVNGDMSWESFAKELEATQADTNQPWWSELPENILKDPVLPFTLGTPALLKGLAPVNNMVRPTALMRQVLGKLMPTASKIASGAGAGVAGVGMMDAMENYAPGAEETTMGDYGIGAIFGGLTPSSVESAKKLGNKIKDKLGNVDISVPKANLKIDELNSLMGTSENAKIRGGVSGDDFGGVNIDVDRPVYNNGSVSQDILDKDAVEPFIRQDMTDPTPSAWGGSSTDEIRPTTLVQEPLNIPIKELLDIHEGTTPVSLLTEKANAKISEFFNPKSAWINGKIIDNTNKLLSGFNAGFNWGMAPHNKVIAPTVSTISDMVGKLVGGGVKNTPYRYPLDAVHIGNKFFPQNDNEKGEY